ncbi:unnamed protein product [Paramecium octaurelia]|uniref:Uncharacterized protein n=1 Tax=Paramecium octaurelia TaxID=43137 RepID=A0A8S1VZZ5_PAROT|nr:unnamed protein product [Paramecium octaurelia]
MKNYGKINIEKIYYILELSFKTFHSKKHKHKHFLSLIINSNDYPRCSNVLQMHTNILQMKIISPNWENYQGIIVQRTSTKECFSILLAREYQLINQELHLKHSKLKNCQN